MLGGDEKKGWNTKGKKSRLDTIFAGQKNQKVCRAVLINNSLQCDFGREQSVYNLILEVKKT